MTWGPGDGATTIKDYVQMSKLFGGDGHGKMGRGSTYENSIFW